MTEQQRAALEALVGRSLTQPEAEEIAPHLPPRRDDLVAEVLSRGRVRIVPTEIGKGDVILALGLDVGNALCDLIDVHPGYRHIRHLLAAGRLLLSAPVVEASLLALVWSEIAPGITLTQAHADALLALARAPDPVTVGQVSDALNSAGA